MNSTQRRVKKLVDNWLERFEIMFLEEDEKARSPEDMGIYVAYHGDGSIGFDGALLDCKNDMSEFGYAENLWKDIELILFSAKYENNDMGVFVPEGWEE